MAPPGGRRARRDSVGPHQTGRSHAAVGVFPPAEFSRLAESVGEACLFGLHGRSSPQHWGSRPGRKRRPRADPDRRGAEDLSRRLEAEFDLELLEEAERRVRRRVAPHTWEAYRLTAIEGLSGTDAAARLGMKATAVFVSRGRVTEQLQREIKALENSPDSGQPP